MMIPFGKSTTWFGDRATDNSRRRPKRPASAGDDTGAAFAGF